MSVPGFHILAGPELGQTGANSFFDSPAGKALVAICGAIAVVIVVFGVFRMINGIGRGRPGEAFKSLIFALLIGGMLFNLGLTVQGVKMMSSLVGKIFTSVDQVGNSGG
ncbi:hypothetical protein AB0C69_17915 [Actinomadura sp. NPDC048032]|uniref:hypothetical protein n=1 Tax=Actinomadura sp. NPDC048032 TaxID=3155747 RepID=UPI0033EF6000